MYQETREVVTIDEWTDRIYQCTPQEIMITNVVSGRKMKVQKYNLSDTGWQLIIRFNRWYEDCFLIERSLSLSRFVVIWNPWDKAKEMLDFGSDEYPNMICVESGQVSQPIVLRPGTMFEASQVLQVRTRQLVAIQFSQCRLHFADR